MIYNEIYNFCRTKNLGTARSNGTEPTPRVKFLMELLDREGIEYELDVFQSPITTYSPPATQTPSRFASRFPTRTLPPVQQKVTNFFNIIMRGSSDKMVIAHHDIVNPSIDNANDNSASVINVIATKKLRPSVHAVLVDGEEIGGIGSDRLGKQIKAGEFGHISWVLNYELTGKGGKNFFIGNYPGPLSDKIQRIFECPVVETPFNDSVVLRRHGIDSCVINPLPPLPYKEPEPEPEYKSWSWKDYYGFEDEPETPETQGPRTSPSSQVGDDDDFVYDDDDLDDIYDPRYYGSSKPKSTQEDDDFDDYFGSSKSKGSSSYEEDDFPSPRQSSEKKKKDWSSYDDDFDDFFTSSRSKSSIPPRGPAPKKSFTTEVITKDGVHLDFSIVYHCHGANDTLANISTTDMKEFVEEVVLKILD